MSSTVKIVPGDSVAYSVHILDESGQPLTEVPADTTVTFTSQDPSVVSVEVQPSGLSALFTGEAEGLKRVVVEAYRTVDHHHMPGSPDTVEVTVRKPEQGNMNLRAGEPA